MAEEQEQAMATEVQTTKKKFNLVALLLGLAVLIVAVIVMFVISNIVVSLRSGQAEELRQETWAPATEGKTSPLSTFAIPTLQINLADPTETMPASVKLTIALAYKDPGTSDGSSAEGGEGDKGKVVSVMTQELDKRSFEIRDKIISIVSAKSYEDLNSPDKQLLLKKEIINQVNAILIHGSIQDVYISDFDIVKSNY